jgi:ankyrin repeat protein
LQVQELIEGIALEIEDTVLDPETFLNDPEDIIDICGSLVVLNLDRGTVALAHFSVKEFFVAPTRKTGAHPEFFIDPRETNFELAKLCVTYLCLEHFGGGRCTTVTELRKRRESYALYSYAVLQWPGHARCHVNVEDEDFVSIVGQLFADSDKNGNYDSWRQAYETFQHGMGSFDGTIDFDDKDPDCSRLLYACRLGLYSLTKHLINSGIGFKAIRSKDFASDPAAKKSGNALNAACESGDAAMAELILSAGADVNAMAGEHGLALNVAISACHYRTGPPDYRLVEILLEKGANVNLVTPDKKWPLRIACGLRDVPCIKLCLDAGAELGWRDSGNSTVFEGAALDGSSQATRERFELLRKHGGGRFINPEFGEMMDLSLMTGADGYGLFLSGVSNLYESAQKILEEDGQKIFSEPAFAMFVEHTFKECAINGFYKFLEQMLVYSGGAFAKYSECVKIAASQGHAKTLGILLDIKAPPLEAGLLEDLMVLAAGRGHQDVVNELTKRGVPPLCTNKHGWTTMLVTTLSVANKEKIDSTLDVFRRVGHGVGSLDSMVKKPSGWVLRPCYDEPAEPSLVFEGTSAYLPPGNSVPHLHAYLQ